MHRLDIATHLTPLDDDELRDLHVYPDATSAPWVRVNFVSSIDGAVSADGTSAGLGTPADKRLFGVLRELADVILVGAGTVRAENYGGARVTAERSARRRERGQADAPPVAVVTASADIDPTSRLLTDTTVAPLVLTTAAAPDDRKAGLEAAGARVLELGESTVPPSAILDTLHGLGLARVLCEGGPALFGQLLAADAVDELCLTTAPLLVAGRAPRIASSPDAAPKAMRRAHLLGDEDGTLLTRWVRERNG
ncbi:pyrimidine reductase family protein [Rhodococcus maanshanensis]|uniref:5-amino-6-(5-phosphoribosylamino)uracil reductase n=1 Tax=Rhodococcus maanshanensis TaxID=183556 RepID=A0A1H7QJY6_9NOCA|nr:pyrimidine reductase family protein [Rhodococcus maanshanensis]SEL47577.1 5-amino-6-(5-phosphoribosylamino)uracil reductase [Rhodococcus maanshanensis]